MTHTTNYFETFIAVSPDTSAMRGQIPPKPESIAGLQYALPSAGPYRWTSDDLVFEISARRKQLALNERPAARAAYFSKGQPCLRSSPLVKQYGWGLHYDAEGRIALYGLDDPRYSELSQSASLKHLAGMRSSRA